MNKKKFLKLLEEKLQILSEEERNDILNEYKDTIEEKVRHGSSEEEAVADFGSMEELSREILKAYKINPDYSKKKEEISKEKVKDIVEQSESLIKKGAKKMSEWTTDFVEDFKNNGQDWTLELVFEIIIKAIIMLIGLSLLRLPFYFIEHLGMSILDLSFPPVDTILSVIWRCLVGIIYFLTCILIAIIVFRPYFSIKEKKDLKKKEKNEHKKIDASKEQHSVSHDSIGRVIIELLKGILFLFLVFPLYFVDFGCYVAVVVLIFLLIQGVPVVGALFILLSVSIFFTFLTKFFYNLLYGKKTVYCYSLIMSAILFVTGCFFLLYTISKVEVSMGIPDNIFEKKEMVYHETLTQEYFTIPGWSYQIEEDSSLQDNDIEIVITYYPDFMEIQNYTVNQKDTLSMYLKTYYRNISRETGKKVYHMIIDELKEYRWYQYHELNHVYITIKANHNMIQKIGKK